MSARPEAGREPLHPEIRLSREAREAQLEALSPTPRLPEEATMDDERLAAERREWWSAGYANALMACQPVSHDWAVEEADRVAAQIFDVAARAEGGDDGEWGDDDG